MPPFQTDRVLPFLSLALLSACALSPAVPSNQPAQTAADYQTQAMTSPALGNTPDLGPNASLHGKQVFDAQSAWNQSIAHAPVDPNSSQLIASIGASVRLHPDFSSTGYGIPYVVVAGTTPKLPVSFDYKAQSDPGPYPVPMNAPIEGGANSTGDRHVLVVDRDHWQLYEMWSAFPQTNSWKAGSGATFNLATDANRPAGWTSADAAGLPIFPGLVRYDEVMAQHAIRHALRFTVKNTRKGYVAPARHAAGEGSSSALPPMGMRVRLKASFNLSAYPPEAQVILQALKTYGMIVADNGSNWYVSGAPDKRWNDEALSTLKKVTGSNFEVVKMGPVTAQ